MDEDFVPYCQINIAIKPHPDNGTMIVKIDPMELYSKSCPLGESSVDLICAMTTAMGEVIKNQTDEQRLATRADQKRVYDYVTDGQSLTS